ncbi:hypothetical protein QOZ95_002220 [Paenibacillus brasilensis]|uniref:Uncharacterized protein n=1 Tax=Paenibacillus brasilensis TaxID=128574 RepID=A0ABU0KX93_9BACL|nr:hypothetical protein [Paenibacillus brasilensis]
MKKALIPVTMVLAFLSIALPVADAVKGLTHLFPSNHVSFLIRCELWISMIRSSRAYVNKGSTLLRILRSVAPFFIPITYFTM